MFVSFGAYYLFFSIYQTTPRSTLPSPTSPTKTYYPLFFSQKKKSMDLQSMVGIPNDPVANEQRLRQGDRISYPAFQVSG